MTNVRLPTDLWKRVVEEAKGDRRSSTSELAVLIEEALDARSSKDDRPAAER